MCKAKIIKYVWSIFGAGAKAMKSSTKVVHDQCLLKEMKIVVLCHLNPICQFVSKKLANRLAYLQENSLKVKNERSSLSTQQRTTLVEGHFFIGAYA
jgi:hypothetical protein